MQHFLLYETGRTGEFTVKLGSYGCMQIKSNNPGVFGLASSNSTSDFQFSLPCYDSQNQKIGEIVTGFSQIQETYYDEIEVSITSDIKVKLIIALIKPYHKDLGKLNEVHVPNHFVIGHRGSGNNLHSDEYLENTIPSFLAAHDKKAEVVEFDIQFTNDNTPIIFHNFYEVYDQPKDGLPPPCCYSEDGKCQYSTNQFSTQQFIDSGLDTKWKQPRATFKDMMTDLPSDLIFDIELKYPFAPIFRGKVPFPERNEFVDRILDEMDLYMGDRQCFFSSFDVTICIMLAIKQHRWPVHQLDCHERTEPENAFVEKVRHQIPIHKILGIQGFVLDSKRVFQHPEIVKEVVDQGYIVSTYGTSNNDPLLARQQIDLGVRGICTDKVHLIRPMVDSL